MTLSFWSWLGKWISQPTPEEVAQKANDSLPPFLGGINHRKVLFVEDEEAIRLVMKRIIKRFNCTFTEAADGKTALALFELGKWDLIILDLKLPDMNGVEVLRTIRQIEPEQPIAVFSGYIDIQTIDEVYTAGWVLLGRKPNDLIDLRALRLMLKTVGISIRPEFL